MPRSPQPTAAADDLPEPAERRLARFPTRTVLTALGGVAVATGWASAAEARPMCECGPGTSSTTTTPDVGTANGAEGPTHTKAPPAPRPVARPATPALDSGTTNSAEHRAETQRPRPVADPGTANSAEHRAEAQRPRPVADPGTANSAEHRAEAQRPRPVADPGTANSAEHRAETQRSKPAADPGTANSAEHRAETQRPKPVADPGTANSAERRADTQRPAAPALDSGTTNSAERRAEAQRPTPPVDPGTANSAERRAEAQRATPVADPGTANSAEHRIEAQHPTVGRQPAKPTTSQPGTPVTPRPRDPGTTTNAEPPLTPKQKADADIYVRTLDEIDARGGALSVGTAQQLRRYGHDPAVVAQAQRIRAARRARDQRLEHGGVESDPDAQSYQLKEQGFDGTSQRSVRAVQRTYPKVGLDRLTHDHNRRTTPLPKGPVKGVPGARGYGWNDGDDDVDYWWPQGIGGQGGEQVTSWYGQGENDGPDDVRIGFTSPDQKGYRFALAVKPNEDGSYDRVGNHAGGVAEYGNYVYVPDTHHGLQVYDTREISEVPKARRTDSDNYKYLLPQVGSYKNTGKPLLFSSVSVDRSEPGKPALVVSEYRNDDDGGKGGTAGDTHIVRWNIDPQTGRLSQGGGQASEGYVTKRDQVQGAAMDHGNIYLSSSQGKTGRLYHGRPGGTIHDVPWSSSPESLYVNGGRLWSLTEKEGQRSVFSVPLPK